MGDIYEHHPGRTVSQQDNAWFTLLTMNTHPLHFDEEYAKTFDAGKLEYKVKSLKSAVVDSYTYKSPDSSLKIISGIPLESKSSKIIESDIALLV